MVPKWCPDVKNKVVKRKTATITRYKKSLCLQGFSQITYKKICGNTGRFWLFHDPRNQLIRKGPWVRIPPSPPDAKGHPSGVLLCFLWRAGLFIKSPFTFLRISSIILVRRYRRRGKVPANRKLRGCIFMKLRKVKAIAKSLLGIFSALMALMLLTYNAVFGYIAIAVMCLYGILVAAFWRCPKCRKNLGPLYVKYCPNCGEKLN